MLAVHGQIGGGDGVRLQPFVARVIPFAGSGYAAVDDEMGHVNVLGRQLPGHALGQAAQPELAHREGRRLRA